MIIRACSRGSLIQDRRFSRSLVLYCIFVALLLFGYFLGVFQSSGWCIDNTNFRSIDANTYRTTIPKKYKSLLVIVVFSAPKNFERRSVIRNTWLKTAGNYSILHFFAIGTTSLNSKLRQDLESENNINHDLLILTSIREAYSKLSKKLLETFRWVTQNIYYSFILKVDDDTFVQLDKFYNAMMLKPQKKLYWGFFDGRANVKKKGKWAEENWYLCDLYMPYAKGGGYVLSQDLVQYIVSSADYLLLFQNEDVTLGAWLAPLDIHHVHDPRFDTEFQSRGCLNSYIITHKQSISMMLDKYKNLKTNGKICIPEVRHRYSYEYNWKVLPSQCCIRNNSKIP